MIRENKKQRIRHLRRNKWMVRSGLIGNVSDLKSSDPGSHPGEVTSKINIRIHEYNVYNVYTDRL